MSNEVRQRVGQYSYLAVASEFLVMGTGFTDLDESPGAKTTTRRYVNDKSETKSISGYDWSTGFTADEIRTKKVIRYLCDIGRLQKTGADAESDYVVVDMDRPGATQDTFYARYINVAVEVKDFKTKDGEMYVEGTLHGKGDVIEGIFDITTRKFTKGWTEPTITTLTVVSAAGTVTGKTALTVTPVLTLGNSYLYKTAVSLTAPSLNEECDFGYTTWDGTTDIVATTGNKIMVVEVDSDKLAIKAGIATVTSKA